MKISRLFSNLCFLAIVMLMACQKQDHGYKEFLEGGEKIYVAKADSLRGFPGKNRIELQWLLLSDPSIASANIYWNNRADSMKVDLVKTDKIDTVSVIIPNLEEGGYDFEVISKDKKGNSSISKTVYAYAYGENYRRSLLPRSISNTTLTAQNELKFTWRKANEQVLSTEIKYLNSEDQERVVVLPQTETELLLPDWKIGSTIQYASWYKPDTLAIDSFLSTAKDLVLTMKFDGDNAVSPSAFKRLKLPGDAADATMNGNAFENLWSGVLAGGAPAKAWYRTETGSGMPQHFQIDLGKKVSLSKLRFWQRGSMTEYKLIYANGNIQNFEIWGSNDPAADGSFSGWTKLRSCEIVKPSNTPVGEYTDADVEEAANGHLFEFPSSTPAYRYVRVKVLNTWAGTDYMFASEFRFWEWKSKLSE